MAIQLGSAYGKIALDVAGLLSGVKKGKEGLLSIANIGQQVGGAMKNVGNMMTLGLTLPIVAMGAASIKAASDFEETKNKAVVVFGEMADSVVANANKSAKAMGISKTQYLDFASSIGAALKAGGMGIEETTALSEQAVKHFADLASFHNGQVEEVALAWQSAIRGQYEPIQRYFPFITDSYLKTYGIANGLVDANTKTLTANQRAIILNAIALNEELNPGLNDFAETAGGLANQGRSLKAEWSDALVMLGQNLLPIALKVASALNKMLEAFNNLSPTQQKILLGFLGLVAIAGPLLSFLGTVVTVISGIAGLAGTLGGLGITLSGVGAALGTVGAVITGTLLPAIGSVLVAAAPIILIIAAIIAVIYLLYLAWKNNFLGIQDIVRSFIERLQGVRAAFDNIRNGTIKLYEDGSGALLNLATAFGFPEEAIQNLLAQVWLIIERVHELRNGAVKLYEDGSGALLNLATAFGFPKKAIQDLLAKIWLIIERVGELRAGAVKLYEDGSGALLDLATAFGFPEEAAQEFLANIYSIIDRFRTIFSSARDWIVNAFTKTDWSQLGKYILFGLANGMLFGLPTLLAAAARIAASLLAQIKKSLGISSRSREAMELGMFTGQGYMLGLRNSMDPNALANLLAKPITNNSSSQQQTIIQNFAGGLTTRQVQGVFDENAEKLIERLNFALGGVR